MPKDTAFQLDRETHARTLSLLEEIKNQANALDSENEAMGHVIHALANSVSWLVMSAQQVEMDSPF
jgi:hypothetical protein